MVCSLKYIEEANIDQEKKEFLNNMHIEIMKEIASATLEEELLFSNRHTLNKNKLLVMQKLVYDDVSKNKLLVQKLKLEALDKKYRKLLNDKYRTPEEGPVKNFIVGWHEVALNPKYPDNTSKIVTVNLSEYLEGQPLFKIGDLDLNIPEDVAKLNNLMNDEYIKSTYIKPVNAIIDSLMSEEKMEKTLGFLDEMIVKVDSQIENVINNKNFNSQFTSEEKRLSEIFYSLKGRKKEENPVERILAITEYVQKSFSILQRIEQSLKRDVFPLVNSSLDLTLEEEFINLRKASSYLVEITMLLETIKPLQDILESVDVGIGTSFWESYNTLKIERELLSAFRTKRKEVISILTSDATNIDAIKVAFSNAGFTSDEIKQANKIIDNNLLQNRNYVAKAFNSLSSVFSKIKSDIIALHFQVVGGQLYNEQLISRNIKSIDEATDDAIKTKEKVIEELKVATADISWLNKWLAGGSQLDDDIARLYAQNIKNAINLATMQNNQLSANAEEHLARLGLSLTEKLVRTDWEKEFVRNIVYIPKTSSVTTISDEELEENPGIPHITRYGLNFKVRVDRALINSKEDSYDGHKVNLDSRLHRFTVKDRAARIFQLLNVKLNLIQLEDYLIDDLKTLREAGLLDENSEDGGIYFFSAKNRIATEENILKVLNKTFWQSTNTPKSFKEQNKILEEQLPDFTEQDVLEELNKKDSSSFYKYIRKNTRESKVSLVTEISEYQLSKMLGASFSEKTTTDGLETGYLIGRDNKGNYVSVQYHEIESEYGRAYRINNPNVDFLLSMHGDFNLLNKRYLSQDSKKLRESLEENPLKKAHYEYIWESYLRSNKNLDVYSLENYLLPFVDAEESMSILDKIKSKFSMKNLWSSLKYKEKNVRIRKKVDPLTGELIQVDENGNPSETPYYIQKTDSVGNAVTELMPRYTIPTQNIPLEQDLFLSLFLLETSSNSYKVLAERENTAHIFKTILRGNKSLGITPRNSYKQSANGNVLFATTNTAATKIAENSTAALESFIKQMFYGEKDSDTSVLGGLSAEKLTRLIKRASAFQLLSNNWVASMTNLILGTVSNFVIASGQRFDLSPKTMTKAYSEYTSNLVAFLEDFAQTSVKKQSKWTQLAFIFDAVKGNLEEGRETIALKKVSDRVLQNILHLSSIAPEHMNQMTLFIGLVQSSEILPGLTLDDIIDFRSGFNLKFNTEKYNEVARRLNKEELDKDELMKKVLLPFKEKLSRILYEAHGQYDKLDSNMLERTHTLSLAYLFQRWLYPGLRVRFNSGGLYSPQFDEIEAEGYILTWLKSMVFKNDTIMNELEGVSFIEKAKDYFKKEGLTSIAQVVATGMGKTVVGVINRVSFNLLADNSPAVEDWLFGDKNEEAKNRLQRAYTELTIFYMTMLVGWLITNAIEDDDDDDDVLKKILLLQAKRLNSDMGFFLSPFIFADKLALKAQDPLSIRHAYETNTGFLKQLIGYDQDSGFTFNDTYEKKGAGYSKGDYKLWIKARKTFFSPYYQMIKLMNPQQSLNFLDLTFNK